MLNPLHLTVETASYLASALAHAACRADFSVRCFRLPRLIDELTRFAALQRRSAFFKQLAKADLLVLDDFGLARMSLTLAAWDVRSG